MTELESLEKSAFNCAKNIINHIEQVINIYMQKNNISLEDWQQYGSYEELETLIGRAGIISYKNIPFHKFEYNALGIIEKTFDK